MFVVFLNSLENFFVVKKFIEVEKLKKKVSRWEKEEFKKEVKKDFFKLLKLGEKRKFVLDEIMEVNNWIVRSFFILFLLIIIYVYV